MSAILPESTTVEPRLCTYLLDGKAAKKIVLAMNSNVLMAKGRFRANSARQWRR